MAIWFTVRLADRPGSLATLAGALAAHGINITGIVGVAEDTDGTLMLTTSDPEATRAVLAEQAIAYEAHDSAGDPAPGGLGEVRRGLADRGFDMERR
ncbi:MAG TPA: ACT domain-containing protein [Candidatus Limnocylindrales bacterium]|nr:ACT domain-containing protein [Candidatus Limnocylindrales bacterium]